jgi:broad specificity phosphatase PhoE
MNKFTIINTVRYGETDYNRNKRYAGTIDVSLNEVGIRDTVVAN